MPGVIDQTSIGFSREVGKMAFLHDDITSAIMNFSTVEEFADKLLESEELDLLSPPPSSSSSPSRENADSEMELLPDYETPVDILNFMDTIDVNDTSTFLPGLSCDDDCTIDSKRLLKASCSNKDPFMGHRDNFKEFISSVDSPLGSDAILGQYRNHLLDDPVHHHQQPIKTEFSAWGHAPSTDDDDEPVLFAGSSSTCSSSSTTSAFSDDQDQDVLPDTPQSYSGTVTGDDSDGDIDVETITDTPHSVDICGYSSSDTSSDISPSSSPSPHNSNKISILHRSSSYWGSNSSSSKPLIRYNSCGVSSSVSLAENLMNGRSIVGKKRKHHKEKYSISKNYINTHNSYSTSYYSTGNSVNFHDYAMSPSEDMSLETAQPTVLSSCSKRVYKRRQLNTNDLSDKEKQNHHNQLERNRRQKLADLFIYLRDEVPSISDQSKASKVMILNQATTYIGDLNKLHKSQEEILTRELHRKEFFKKQLKQLEAQLSRS